MANIDYMHRRQHLTSLALASLGDCPRWDAAATAYLRAQELQWAFGEWGPLAQATDARGMAVLKHGDGWKNDPIAAAEIEALKKAEDEQQAIWEDSLLPDEYAATAAIARTPAPNAAAAVFKAQMIEVAELWNTPRFEDDCLQIVRDDFARLEGAGSNAFVPAQWLADFEQVGGGWVVRDELSLVICPNGRTDEELSKARELVVSLTDDNRAAIVDHLAANPERQAEGGRGKPDAELVAAWERRKAAFACYNALPFADEPGGDEEAEKGLWAIIDAAEEVIYQTPAKTPDGVSFKLLASLGHTFTDKKHSDAANVGDLLALVVEDGLDWNEKLILSALRSLKTMGHCTEAAQPQPEPPYEELKRLGMALEERSRHAGHMLTAIDDALEVIACDGSNIDALDRALSFLSLAKKELAECSDLANQVDLIGVRAGRV